MQSFLLIVLFFAAGYFAKQYGIVKRERYKVLNYWVIYIGLPAVALRFVPTIEWSAAYIFTAILPFAVFLLSFCFFFTLNSWLKLSKRTLVTLILVSGLSNTSFVGFPLIIAFFGEEYLNIGVVSDQVTFFILSSLGVILASYAKSSFTSFAEKAIFITRRIIIFPPFIACIMALLFGKYIQQQYTQQLLSYLVMTVSPVALFSIGLQLQFRNIKKESRFIFLSLVVKLLLAPALALVLAIVFNLRGVFFQVSIFEMAMPTLVASGILIEYFGLNVKLANTIIGISLLVGILLSFAWYQLVLYFL